MVRDVCPRGLHSHTFFELIFIHDGEGTQYINETAMNYKRGDLFLVAPNDNHLFKIKKPTQFFFIRFNDVFVRSPKERQRLKQLEMILSNARHEPGCVIVNEADRSYSINLLGMIIAEHQEQDLYHNELINQLINTLLILVARNINRGFPVLVNESSEKKILDILSYIQSNIYSPVKLRTVALSDHFGIAENYLGPYFKQHTNESLQQYIMKYKLRLIENRLLHTGMRVKEIADELGFTDKSHLNRIFKKYRGISPTEFKRQFFRNSFRSEKEKNG
ncbi:helix-turn-helix transcriptional regulator [Spirosoma sp. BT702]|uniref:Helix-turn-helix transcriptional regulator n=1 Tax=Spirosoma profusum TaxID=2771354 RepID=A0A926Y5G1_9BACT|nr:AraC family transcriptional regulator [Spirosoma profusum]MBD2704645.1 helix-turn-helix transcriptional regulator [Spirosoma profusum]